MPEPFTIAIAGGGAAGFFAAITCAESLPDARVVILERSPEVLAKVIISGGGRCNVTHACFEPKDLVRYYPRGHRELLGPLHRWQPSDTVNWFASRGVELKTEPDNRMFPVTDRSSTIADCLISHARDAGVEIRTGCGVASIERDPKGFVLGLADGGELRCRNLLVATGGNRNSGTFREVAKLGHTVKPLVPSLFSFNCRGPLIEGLSGISVEDVEVSIHGTPFRQRGPLLITHWGVSGPAVLKLSAWAAPEFARMEYVADILVDWIPGTTVDGLDEDFAEARRDCGGRLVVNWNPWRIPQRLWEAMAASCGIDGGIQWGRLNAGASVQLRAALKRTRLHMDGKSMNKDEFVTCGGVSLDEVNFKTMGSRICPGLYFAGEILDIDGVTGGFNFQAAWTTGWIAGKSMGQDLFHA